MQGPDIPQRSAHMHFLSTADFCTAKYGLSAASTERRAFISATDRPAPKHRRQDAEAALTANANSQYM
jgi:hypothetical protein